MTITSNKKKKAAVQVVQTQAKKLRSQIKKLHVYDFDGTLMNTPLPTSSTYQYYREKTGQNFCARGWWGHPASLEPPMRDLVKRGPAFDAFLESIRQDDTHVVVLTGRHDGLKIQVEEILASHELKPHQVICKPETRRGKRSMDTLPFKLQILSQLVSKFNCVESMKIFEDRIDHVRSFSKLHQNHIELTRKIDVEVIHCKSSMETALDL